MVKKNKKTSSVKKPILKEKTVKRGLESLKSEKQTPKQNTKKKIAIASGLIAATVGSGVLARLLMKNKK